ncbi:MAG TPA: ABC transporter permease, partial [Albitalea sp.]|nr:ABC transporter permease [Albitalea sp.]
MRSADVFAFARGAAAGSPLRTLLMMLAMAIGVAAVVVLTALGDGARRYVVDQFASLGTNLVIVLPGRSQTGGFSPANVITSTPRDLTIADARALLRAGAVKRVAPAAVGLSELSSGGRLRETMVLGTTSEYLELRRLPLAQGRFLPDEEWDRGSAVVVLGAKLRSELFGSEGALGRTVRVGDRRFRVIGVLGSSGQGLGMNIDE